MAQRKALSSTGKRSVRKEQTATQLALTSSYNMMIPLYEAAYVYVVHPTTRDLMHFSTSSESFLVLMKELFDLGVGPRIVREFAEFAVIDIRWESVASRVADFVAASSENTEVALDESTSTSA